jgi:O-antigen/teichoic acid export membrane protein
MKKNNLKQDVIISYISVFLIIISTFVLTKYQVKFLGKDQYGIISLVNSVIGYVSILDLGIGQTIIRYISLYRAKGENYKIEQIAGYSFKSYIRISIIGLVVGGSILFVSNMIFPNLTNNQMDLFRIAFLVALINIVLQIPGATFNAILTAHERFKFLRGTNTIRSILRVIIMIILFKLGFRVVMVFLVDLVLNQGINIINYLVVRYSLKIKLNFNKLDTNVRKEIYTYSFFVFLGIITDQIFWKTDGIIIGIMGTVNVVGVYSISGQIISQYLNICATFSSVFLPKLTHMIAENRPKSEINKFFIKASRYQFILVAMILINYIFLGKQFIILWLGNNMIDAYYYGLVIFISLTVPMFQTTGYQILYAMNKHKVRSMIYLFNAIINIIISVILFKIYGAIGPALATAIAMIAGNTVIINIYYKKTLELKLIDFFYKVCNKTLVVSIIISIVFIVLNRFTDNGILSFLLKVIIGNILYTIGIYFYTLSKEEKMFILKKLHRSYKLQNSNL